MKKSDKNQNQARVNPKKQAVSLAIDQIQKQFGRGAIMRLGEGPVAPVSVIKTGILPLDLALGLSLIHI